jgi:hypothetical protein
MKYALYALLTFLAFYLSDLGAKAITKAAVAAQHQEEVNNLCSE